MAVPFPHGVVQAAEQVQQGTATARQLVEIALARGRAVEHLNAFLSLQDNALAQADSLDARRARGETLGPLAGVPIAIKDALCTRDAPTTAASRILTRDGRSHSAGWIPDYDATVISRLRDADAILIGKTNMDEFAMGSSNENSAFGAVKNPWDPERVPGGSSGGSAAAVAARVAPVSLGSDTGGSIRQPAGLCGVVGVKPSYGRVSRYGLIAFASSLDQVGPLASDVRGAARTLSVIAGHCPNDSTSSELPVEDYEAACERGAEKLRVGVPAQYFEAGVDDEVREAVESVVDALRNAGCTIHPVELPHTGYGISTYYVIATAEASSNLSRFDGVRFGLRVEEQGASLADVYSKTRGTGFGPEVKRRIMLGTYALSSGYYDAYYRKAQQVRTLIRRDFDQAFNKVDLLVTPASPSAAFCLGERIDNPLQMYLADVFTLPASLAGICGITLPAGMTRRTPERPELPIGVQLLAKPFAEQTLFAAAAYWESQCPVSGRFATL